MKNLSFDVWGFHRAAYALCDKQKLPRTGFGRQSLVKKLLKIKQNEWRQSRWVPRCLTNRVHRLFAKNAAQAVQDVIAASAVRKKQRAAKLEKKYAGLFRRQLAPIRALPIYRKLKKIGFTDGQIIEMFDAAKKQAKSLTPAEELKEAAILIQKDLARAKHAPLIDRIVKKLKNPAVEINYQQIDQALNDVQKGGPSSDERLDNIRIVTQNRVKAFKNQGPRTGQTRESLKAALEEFSEGNTHTLSMAKNLAAPVHAWTLEPVFATPLHLEFNNPLCLKTELLEKTIEKKDGGIQASFDFQYSIKDVDSELILESHRVKIECLLVRDDADQWHCRNLSWNYLGLA